MQQIIENAILPTTTTGVVQTGDGLGLLRSGGGGLATVTLQISPDGGTTWVDHQLEFDEGYYQLDMFPGTLWRVQALGTVALLNVWYKTHEKR